MSMPRRSVNFQTVRLRAGSHHSPEEGACVMELASMLAGEPFSDCPDCVCPVVAAVLRRINDLVGDGEREELRSYASQAIGTRAGALVEDARIEHCLAWVRSRRRRVPLLGISAPVLLWDSRAKRDRLTACMVALEPHLRRRRGRSQELFALVDDLLAIGSASRSKQTPQRQEVDHERHFA